MWVVHVRGLSYHWPTGRLQHHSPFRWQELFCGLEESERVKVYIRWVGFRGYYSFTLLHLEGCVVALVLFFWGVRKTMSFRTSKKEKRFILYTPTLTWHRRSGSMSASLVMTLISLPLQPSLGTVEEWIYIYIYSTGSHFVSQSVSYHYVFIVMLVVATVSRTTCKTRIAVLMNLGC